VLDWAEQVTAVEDKIRAAARGGMRLSEARKTFGYHSLQTREKS
jgi:4-hydroxy-4-methyl-2-oxoglutarate aldolase